MTSKKQKLVFYSGGQQRSNHQLHEALVGMMSQRKRKKTMVYIPYCNDGSGVFFSRFKRRYKRFGIDQFHCIPVDEKISKKDISNILSSDAVYMAGGNTFYFLKNLKKAGLFKHLRAYSKSGGILAGLSAGAIMMTPNIHMAAFPPFDPDENDVGLKKLNALNLVNFEFFPHYEDIKSNIEAMMMYSLISKQVIYACPDGSGIVLNGNEMKMFGEVFMFFRGNYVKVTQGQY